MYIATEINKNLVLNYHKRNAASFFSIHIENNDFVYPNLDWMDFGATILGWWLVSAANMAAFADEEQLMFMDGPYFIKTTYDREQEIITLKPNGVNVVWSMNFLDFATELIRASNQVYRNLPQSNMGNSERVTLQKGIAGLRSLV